MGMGTKFEIPVVGVTFQKGYPETISGIAPNDEAFLVRDADNPSDTNAIRVETAEHVTIGYVPAAIAKRLAPEMDAGESFEATIRPVINDNHLNKPGAMLTVTNKTRVS